MAKVTREQIHTQGSYRPRTVQSTYIAISAILNTPSNNTTMLFSITSPHILTVTTYINFGVADGSKGMFAVNRSPDPCTGERVEIPPRPEVSPASDWVAALQIESETPTIRGRTKCLVTTESYTGSLELHQTKNCTNNSST